MVAQMACKSIVLNKLKGLFIFILLLTGKLWIKNGIHLILIAWEVFAIKKW